MMPRHVKQLAQVQVQRRRQDIGPDARWRRQRHQNQERAAEAFNKADREERQKQS